MTRNRDGIQVFIETAENFHKYGTSYPERVKVLEKIAAHVKKKEALQSDPELLTLIEELKKHDAA